MKYTFWILILSACVADSALAQRGPGRGGFGRGGFEGGPPQGMFGMIPIQAALDTDKDGKISATEIEKATASLRKLDRNKDGALTEDELRPEFGRGREGREGRGPGEGERGGPQSGHGQRGGPQGGEAGRLSRLMEYDKNKDGKLSTAELPGPLQSLMARVDTDKDGLATQQELAAAMPAAPEGRQGRGGFGGRGERGPGEHGPGEHGHGEHGPGQHGERGMQGPGGPGGPEMGPRANPQEMLNRAFEFDVNKDGMLSRAELEKMFAAGPPEGGRERGGQGRGGRGRAERGGQNRRPPTDDK